MAVLGFLLWSVGLFASADDFSANWMAQCMPVLGGRSILDLALPGTHDSLTSDLSKTVADNSNDLPPAIAWVLHEFHSLTPGSFIRNQSQTQVLDMTAQLEAGVRFIDFRIVFTGPPDGSIFSGHQWYGLHLVQTNQPALHYLQQILTFLESHKGEVIVLSLSYHGSFGLNGTAQYPDATVADKQALWSNITAMFEGLLFDTELSSTNETTLSSLIAKNHRLIVYASDYAEFTGKSPLALDAAVSFDNQLGAGDVGGGARVTNTLAILKTANAVREAHKRENRFWLQSMAAGFNTNAQIEDAALVHYDPFSRGAHTAECAAAQGIPNMTFCPMSLLEAARLTNYQNQITLDKVISTPEFGLPNAVYLDAVDANGCILTGSTQDAHVHANTGFAYVDTFVLFNVKRACNGTESLACTSLDSTLSARRAKCPLARWDDPAHGRSTTWPVPS